MTELQVNVHQNYRRCDGDYRHCIESHELCALNKYQYADRKAYDACNEAGDVFPYVNSMTDVDHEVPCKRHEYSEPESVKYVVREIICKEAYAEERDEFFVDCKRKAFVCESAVRIHCLWEALEQIRIPFKEPDESGDLFHVVKNEDDG